MKKISAFSCFCVLVLAGGAFAQGDRGTITGTIVDSQGAIVPKATVNAHNNDTGNILTTQTTDTGAYTLSEVPIGRWDVIVEAPGFKAFKSANNEVLVAVTTRVDATLQVGAATESVTVQASAVELKTEEADVSTTVTRDLIVELPITWANGWFGNQAVRNPLSIEQIMPGVSGGTSYFGTNGQTSGGAAIVGQPTSTFKLMLEGQDDTSLYTPSVAFKQQPSVEALQELTLQTSGYQAEFGQAQGGIYNFTTKSGTNTFHGGLFYRLTNEDLNAHQPYSGSRPPSRQNNYGGTLGGPIIIPHIYNGHNKLFFFFAYEGFKSVLPASVSGSYTTMPTAAERAGNFGPELGAQALCSGKTCVDASGSAVLAGEIFDPKSVAADGYTRFPFPNNSIPMNRMDPVALKFQSLLPAPTNGLQANNYLLSGAAPRPEEIPSIKIDYNISEKLKLSAYDSGQNGSYVATPDGLPSLLSAGRPDPSWSNTTRVSIDYNLKPTMLLHLGAGYWYTSVPDNSYPQETSFNQVSALGLTGAIGPGMPNWSGLGDTSASGAPIGGAIAPAVSGAGTFGSRFNDYTGTDELTAVAALSWIERSHSYKFGANWQESMEAQSRCDNQWGTYVFAAAQTGQPYGPGGSTLSPTTGTPGLNYASFLLGLPNSATIAPCNSVNWHDHAWAFYAQDTWKVTRRLTFNYGLRYDLQNPPREDRNRISTFSGSVLNPSAGNLPGGVLYQGFGPGTCNCSNFLNEYKFALGPRLGIAFQLNSKTVVTAGWGFFYGGPWTQTGGLPNPSAGTGYDTIISSSLSAGLPALPNGLQGGLTVNSAQFAATKGLPGAVPTTNPATGLSNLTAPSIFDRAEGRPPRISEYNVGLQREIIRGMTLEAAYVGNRGVWILGAMSPINDVTPAILAAHGLSLSNPANLTLLSSTIGSAAVKAAGFTLPFSNFPPATTLANALRPYPQFNSSLTPTTTDGDSWYNSLQMKLTARLSNNITALGTYTWAKSLDRLSVFDNWQAFNTQRALDPNSIPQALQVNVTYQTPHLFAGSFFGGNKVSRAVLSDWQISAVLRYQSGALILAPTSNDNLSVYLAGAPAQYMTRVPGQPLYLVNPNGHIDPTKQLILNPQAWMECGPTATFGCGAPYYSDFRQRRTPQENIGLGRRFTMSANKDAARFLEIRMEWYNPFNRIVFPNVSVGNPLASPTHNSNGLLTGGFGFINVNNIAVGTARNLLVVARFSF